MIIDKPEPKDFEKQSVQFLLEALDLIRSRTLTKSDVEVLDIREEDHWKYHQGTLNTSLTLIFLSLENHLKREICDISPLLLLAGEPKRWKTSNPDKKYSSLYMHQFDDLLALFRELHLGQISTQTTSDLKELRQKRNQITHGFITEEITPEYVLKVFHTLIVNIWGPKTWWAQFKKYLHLEPASNSKFDPSPKGNVTNYIDLLVFHLGKSKTGEILGVNLKQRNYHCPSCTYIPDKHTEPTNYAILKPNESASTVLYCVICDNHFEVERKDCQIDECKGNVFGNMTCLGSDDCCLTCCDGFVLGIDDNDNKLLPRN